MKIIPVTALKIRDEFLYYHAGSVIPITEEEWMAPVGSSDTFVPMQVDG
jgi:hypothetical protein